MWTLRRKHKEGTSLVVQWLTFSAANAENVGLIAGQAAKIPHAITHEEVKAIRRKKRKASISFWPMLLVAGPMAILSHLLPPSVHTWDEEAKYSISQPPQEDTHLLIRKHVETTLSERSKLQNCTRKKTMWHTQVTHTHTHMHVTLQVEFHGPSPPGSVPPPPFIC